MLAQHQGLGGRGDIPRALAFSPDAKVLATAGEGGRARLRNVATRHGSARRLSPGGGPVLAVTFSPSGKIRATDSEFKARLWAVATRRQLGGAAQLWDLRTRKRT